MDAHRFDALSRTLASRPSRRRLLAGLIAGLSSVLPRHEASARCKKRCGPCKRCKKGKCKPKPAGIGCPGGTCQRGSCQPSTPPPGCQPVSKAQACAGRTCGAAIDNCGQTVPCTGCAGCCAGNTCVAPGSQTDPQCGNGNPGATCAACTGDAQCTGGSCIVPACGDGGPCLVFVTSEPHNGNLKGSSATGLDGADAICQQLAANRPGELPPLPGTYKAWLSDSTGSPASNRFTKSTGPYRLVDGTKIADDWDDLTTCDGSAPFDCLENPINVDEMGNGPVDADAWTNTSFNGAETSPPADCANWTSDAAEFGHSGHTTQKDTGWSEFQGPPCNATVRLFCFQQS